MPDSSSSAVEQNVINNQASVHETIENAAISSPNDGNLADVPLTSSPLCPASSVESVYLEVSPLLPVPSSIATPPSLLEICGPGGTELQLNEYR